MKQLSHRFLILTSLLFIAAAAFAERPPVRSFEYGANVRTVKTSYKTENYEEKDGELYFYMEESLSDMLFTPELVEDIYKKFRAELPRRLRKKELHIISKSYPIEEFIPNKHRKSEDIDSLRLRAYDRPSQVVERLSLPYEITKGLNDRTIALWPSHGLYYNRAAGKWEWQRPALFGTIEDLMTASVVLTYLAPMLRNAGAELFIPRERDINPNSASAYIERTDSGTVCSFSVPEPGYYWIKLWYAAADSLPGRIGCEAESAGEIRRYAIDMNKGRETWIYLDRLYLEKDLRLRFSGEGNYEIEAARIGGGSSVHGSPVPPYAEGARYFLQESCVPDSILYCTREGYEGDYYDDLYSRARYVNHLAGGSHVFKDHPGLGIPIDACLALHTDASKSGDHGIEGTLVLCTADSLFPSGVSRLASSDLAHYISEQIMSDCRAAADTGWSNRGIWRRNYVESRVPQVPSALVEMWAHTNFADVKLALDPRFRFLMARAVYKGLLRYMSEATGREYQVQPLPPEAFSAVTDGGRALLSWQPAKDELEPDADPDGYVIYTRVNGGSFDSGRYVSSSSAEIAIQPDSIYSFKITAVNAGGESFPSEILSLCSPSSPKGTVAIVNGFDRISGPESFETDSLAGFLYERDMGVPYLYDLAYYGDQYEFSKSVPFQGNAYPGHGASFNSASVSPVAGNSFDYAYVHGRAIRDCGYGFVSISKKAFEDALVDVSDYEVLDLLLGKQRDGGGFELYSERLQSAVRHYLAPGGRKLIVSGAYAASPSSSDFAEKVLRVRRLCPWASLDGAIVDPSRSATFSLEQDYVKDGFVQSVDALRPAGKEEYRVLLQYRQAYAPAALGISSGGNKIITAGFPIESLSSESYRTVVMREFLGF